MTLSDPTLGVLIDVGAARFSGKELKTLMMRAGLFQYGHREDNKQELLRSRFLGARAEAQEGDAQAHRALLAFVRVFVEAAVPDPESPPRWFDGLCQALLADGYQLTWDRITEESRAWTGFDEPYQEITVSYDLLPTDAGAVPLGLEISALERELDARGYSDALNHYRQAVDAF